ncbi:nuclear transport factor 2 family protein [Haloferula chungangensis]|uniref:Nuclear transport factor 2 family protein n=1 Tax=Haloferula chungangensis TaxID=1048331 RepID=A0ABW2LBR4_9BACT
MRPTLLLTFFLPIGFLACKPQADTPEKADHGWGKDSSEIDVLQSLNDKLTDAYEREDIALLRELLSEDHIHNNVFVSRLTKDEFLKDIESGVLIFESYQTPEIEWYITDQLAVATGVIEARATRAGNPVPATTFRFTRIYHREAGGWKVLLFQNAMIPAKAPTTDP